MTIINFKPSAWQDGKIDKAQNIQQKRYDSSTFVDYDLDSEDKFIKTLTPSQAIKASKESEPYDRAKYVLCEAIMERNEVANIIEYGAKKNYTDLESPSGYITFDFESDPLGRGIMFECDKKGRILRETTFIEETGEIYKIITSEQKINAHSGQKKKGYNQITFFNYDESHIEVKKGVKKGLLGTIVNEFFGFEKGEPKFYKVDYNPNSDNKNCKQEYIF